MLPLKKITALVLICTSVYGGAPSTDTAGITRFVVVNDEAVSSHEIETQTVIRPFGASDLVGVDENEEDIIDGAMPVNMGGDAVDIHGNPVVHSFLSSSDVIHATATLPFSEAVVTPSEHTVTAFEDPDHFGPIEEGFDHTTNTYGPNEGQLFTNLDTLNPLNLFNDHEPTSLNTDETTISYLNDHFAHDNAGSVIADPNNDDGFIDRNDNSKIADPNNDEDSFMPTDDSLTAVQNDEMGSSNSPVHESTPEPISGASKLFVLSSFAVLIVTLLAQL